MADIENFRVFFTDPENKYSAKINEEGVKLFYGVSYKTWTWEQLYNQAILEAMNPVKEEGK